jgi:hypothetical protein
MITGMRGRIDDNCRFASVVMLLAWVVTQDEGTYRGQFVARLVTDAPTPYVLLADTLAGLHAQLPSSMGWSDRQPADPPEVLEIWFLPTR